MSSKRKIILALGSVVALLIVIALARFVTRQYSNACLTGDDYKDLTNQPMPPTDPKINFYSYVMEYTNASTTSPDTQPVVNALTSFYKSHPRKSIVITISGVNQAPATNTIAATRIESFTDQLIEGGVDSSAIDTSDPQFLGLDADYDGVVTATITTGKECRE